MGETTIQYADDELLQLAMNTVDDAVAALTEERRAIPLCHPLRLSVPDHGMPIPSPTRPSPLLLSKAKEQRVNQRQHTLFSHVPATSCYQQGDRCRSQRSRSARASLST